MDTEEFLEEQNYLKKVEDLIKQKKINKIKQVEKLKEEVIAIGIPNFDEKEHFQNIKNTIYQSGKILKDLEDSKNSPYFGRMDLRITDDVTEFQTMYIGEKSIILDDITKKNLVYDWRSPVANLYYMNNQDKFAYNETSYELHLKRQIDIKNAKLKQIYTLYKRGSNLNVQDNFLLKILNEKKNRNEFTDIIRTIQSNQNNIIRENLFSNVIVQGVAGSGKTVVLLHRLSYILYNYKELNKDKLVFITPSRIFQSKLSKINRSLSLTTIKMLPMEEYYLEKMKYYIPSFKINVILKDEENIDTLKFIYSDKYLTYLDNIIERYFSKYKEIIKNNSKLEFDNNKILSSLTSNNNILKKMIDNIQYNSLKEKENILELIKITNEYLKKDNLKKILNIIYKDLQKKYRLRSKNYINNNKVYKCYMYTLLWIYIKYGYNTYTDYNYMYIDEMQDYSDSEFRLITKFEKNTHLNLYGDINQNILEYIDKKSIKGLNTLLKDILHTENITNYKLEENYRNSKEITSYCNNFIDDKMISMGINSYDVEIINIIDNIYENIIKNFDTNTIIITKDKELEEKLKSKNYEVYDIKSAKGLEFSRVLVIDDDFTNTEKYVAYTRTLNKLTIYKRRSN